ncbi:MAG: hypothetical protein HYZ53_25035 [Planctomycetes bacterium]|nr:hypothetical protein [Planctomycetota bacterium]
MGCADEDAGGACEAQSEQQVGLFGEDEAFEVSSLLCPSGCPEPMSLPATWTGWEAGETGSPPAEAWPGLVADWEAADPVYPPAAPVSEANGGFDSYHSLYEQVRHDLWSELSRMFTPEGGGCAGGGSASVVWASDQNILANQIFGR